MSTSLSIRCFIPEGSDAGGALYKAALMGPAAESHRRSFN
jgi:hypothetical protein